MDFRSEKKYRHHYLSQQKLCYGCILKVIHLYCSDKIFADIIALLKFTLVLYIFFSTYSMFILDDVVWS